MTLHLLLLFLGFQICAIIAQRPESFKDISNLGIFGGQDAEVGQFPYQVSIQRCSKIIVWRTCEHFCGGTIISPNWILTAGHCYEYGLETQIVAGVVNRTEESEFSQIIGVNQTLVHKDYIGNANPNDIRLYQLKTPLVFNDRVQPIALPAPNYDTVGDVTASGWGYSKGGLFPVTPVILQYQVSNMPEQDTCYQLANQYGKTSYNVTTNVCTENPEANHGICSGDSGGPLVQNGTIVGISSWGFSPCGKKNAPSCFTRVSNYIDWIKERVPEL